MIPIRISRKALGSVGVVALTPSWVGNAHWLIRRTCVENVALFATKDTVAQWLHDDDPLMWTEVEDAFISEKMFDPTPKTFTVTRLRVGPNATICVTDGDYALADARFLELFGLREGTRLYGKNGMSPLANAPAYDDAECLLMPMRPDDYSDLVAHLTKWLPVVSK